MYSGLSGLGGVFINAGGLISFESQSNDASRGGPSPKSTAISFRPSVDTFLGEHLTLGAALGVSHFETSTTSATLGGATILPSRSSGYELAFAPRIGRTFDLGSVILWPKVGVGYGVFRAESQTSSSPSGRNLTRTLNAELDVDLVFPVTRHLVFVLGPTLGYTRASVDSNSTIGLLGGDGERVSAGLHAFIGVTL
jgi:hypothetical protein